MGLRGMEVALALALVCAFWAGAMAQSSCTTAIVSLSPCLNYITGNSSTPTASCCSQLASVVKTQPLCLCLVLSGSASSLGISINQTQALALPSACNVQTPPISQCQSASPENSPAGTSDAPTSPSSLPSTPNTPAGTGSNTNPSPGGSSNGNLTKLPLPMLLFLLFLASSTSVLNCF